MNDDTKAQFIEAIMRNDTISIKDLFNKYQNKKYNLHGAFFTCPALTRINKRNQNETLPDTGLTLLHVAAFYDSFETFFYLNQYQNFDLATTSTNNFLPLHYSCISGSFETSLFILSADPSEALYQIPETTFQLIKCAIIGRNYDILKNLFENGAKINPLFQTDFIENAISVQSSEILSLVIKNATFQNQEDEEMPLSMKAVLSGNPTALKLIYRKSDITKMYKERNLISFICNIDSKKAFKAILMDILRDVENITIEPVTHYYTEGICHWACKYFDLDVAKIMFNRHDFNPNRLDSKFKTGAAYLALKKGKEVIQMLELLIERGFDINTKKDENSISLLESFISSPPLDIDAIKFLIRSGADLNANHSVLKCSLYDLVKKKRDKKLKEAFNIL